MAKFQSHITGFPVFAIARTAVDNQFLVGGGGGASKAGIKNTVFLCVVDDSKITERAQFDFSKDDDGCMSLAAHPTKQIFIAGVNQSQKLIESNQNNNARYLFIKNEKIRMKPEQCVPACATNNSLQYLRVCQFSRDGNYVFTGSSDGKLSFWNASDMTEFIPSQEFADEEILDINVDAMGSAIAVTSPSKLRIIDLKKGRIRWVMNELVVRKSQCTIRCAKFGVGPTEGYLFVLMNQKDRKGSFLLKYQISDWSLVSTSKVTSKPITAFCISDCGRYFAFGSADLSISVLDATTLRSIVRLKDAHSFPVTAIEFNCHATLVVSGSADGTIGVVQIPREESKPFEFIHFLAALLLIFVAFIFLSYGSFGEL